jgi:hypothetical protein
LPGGTKKLCKTSGGGPEGQDLKLNTKQNCHLQFSLCASANVLSAFLCSAVFKSFRYSGLVTGYVNWGGASNRVSSEVTALQCAKETCKISTRSNTIINIESLFCNKIFIYIS